MNSKTHNKIWVNIQKLMDPLYKRAYYPGVGHYKYTKGNMTLHIEVQMRINDSLRFIEVLKWDRNEEEE